MNVPLVFQYVCSFGVQGLHVCKLLWNTSMCNENLHNSANFFISNRNCLFINSLILFIHLQSFVIHGDHLQCFSNLFEGVVQYVQVNMCRHNLKYIYYSVKQRTGSFEIIERVNIQNKSTIWLYSLQTFSPLLALQAAI